MHTTQKRRFERALARFPVWMKCASSGVTLQGCSANVSVGGMYLLTAGDLEFCLGAEVSVVFGIRDEEHGGYVLHEAPSGAAIVRLEKHGYGTGIAVKFAEPRIARCSNSRALA
jgi:hypothetical protein